MDGDQFDALLRALVAGASRRRALGALTGGLLATVLSAPAPDMARGKQKKKKIALCLDGQTIQASRKQKKKLLKSGATPGACSSRSPSPPVPGCTPGCAGRECGDDGCGASCGACSGGKSCQDGTCSCPGGLDTCAAICCAECQECDRANSLCIMETGSDGVPCTAGSCCGGACCPPSCQCGVPGLSGQLADLLAGFYGLPYPICNAIGTGQFCNPDAPACQPGTSCIDFDTPIGEVGVCAGLCPGVKYPAL